MYSKKLFQTRVTPSQKKYVERVRDDNRGFSAAEVVRAAIDVLMMNEDVTDDPRGYGDCSAMLGNASVSNDQYDFVVYNALAKGVSKAQVVRDALKALEISGMYL